MHGNITSVKVGKNVKTIGDWAFWGCPITSLDIPEGVISIGGCAFYGCYIKSLLLPNSLKDIGTYAFYGSSNLESLTIPANLSSIEEFAFGNCPLVSISVDKNNTSYDSRNNCNAIIRTENSTLILGCKNTIIPEGVSAIQNNSFHSCKDLLSINIPSSVLKIGNNTFENCTNLKYLYASEGLQEIGDNAFKSCFNLSKINLPSTLISIGEGAFCYCPNLISVVSQIQLPFAVLDNSFCSGWQIIDGNVIINPTAAVLYVPSGTKENYQNSGWNNFVSIVEGAPKEVTIDGYTYSYSLEERVAYVIPDDYQQLDKVEIPSSIFIEGTQYRVKGISKGTFTYGEMTSVVIDSGIETIAPYAFFNCMHLKELKLPASLKMIGNSAFEACLEITNIVSEAITPVDITDDVFSDDLYSKATLKVPYGSKTNYQEAKNWTKFVNIEEMPAYDKGFYFRIQNNEAEIVSGSIRYSGEIVIPEIVKFNNVEYPVTSISKGAFWGCEDIVALHIPSSVTSIAVGSFVLCSNLASIVVDENNPIYDSRDNCNAIVETATNTLISGCMNTSIPNDIVVIGDCAFEGQLQLKSITIPNGVTTIGGRAFRGVSFTSLEIPGSVTSIGKGAFEDCDKLTSLIVKIPTPLSVDQYTFWFDQKQTTLYVPSGSESLYGVADYWKDFKEIKAIEDPDEFSLNFMGQTIKDGATLLINAEGWSGLGSIYTDTGDNTKNGLFIFISKGGKVSGNYSLEIISNTLNGDLKWSMGDETYALNEVTKLEKSFSTDENGIASVKFSAENIPNEGSLDAKLMVTIGEKTKTFYIKIQFKKKDSPDLTVSGKVGEPVDLGLSVKWASWNVGAGAPEEYGNHYAWGELEPKTDYSASTYKFYSNGYTKYGSVDKKYELDEADDVARQKWGKDWRMPTFSELKELYEKCSFSQEVLNGIPVTKVTGPNGNYIYMPGPGNFTGQTLYFKDNVGSYWSRNLETDSYAKDLDFFTGSRSLNGDTRYHGQSVRPVYAGETSNIRTIHVAQAGTLPTLISDEEKYTIEELALTGELNGTDFRLLRDMAGNNYKGEETEGKLRRLDISGARIVAGGDMHIDTDHYRNGNASGSGPFHFSVDASDELPSGAFLACKLESVLLPRTITKINQNAFMTCVNLTSINIPASVTTIGSVAFYNCSNLSSLLIPYSVNSIQNQAFEGCSGLTSIIVDGGNPIYDSRNNCNAIIKTADNTLISGCLNTIIPNTVSTIGRNAFLSCNALKSISIPNSVTSIDYGAFSRCGLTSIKIPYSVTSIKQGAFSNCSDLTSITVEDGNRAYDSRDNCNAIIETSTNTLIIGCNKTVIPNTVTSIGHSAFINCQILSSVTIPDGVTAIGDYAFSGCSQLSSITIPNSVTSIGRAAFQSCRNLSSATLSDKLTSIGDWIFNGCRNLNSIEIPQNVNSIGEYAFQGCSALSNVTCRALTPPSVDAKAFSNISIENITLYVLSGCVEAYKAAEPWNQFKEIKAITSYEEPSSIIETPLTFEAVEGTVTVDIRNYFCSYMPTIQYRIDGGTWTNFSLSNNECKGTQRFSNYLPAGKIVQVRGNLPSGHFWEGDGFDIDCLEDCYVYGNVMSLFNGESFADNSDICETNMGGLFHDNIHIKNHPDKDIILPATTLYNSCYMGMFKGCTGLTRAPKLPATTLAESCYAGMFKDCTGLIEAPELPATKLEKWCYHMMFEGCTSLKTIKCLATDNIVEGDHNIGMAFWKNGDDNGTVTDWLKDAGKNVSGTKTFIVNDGLAITGSDPETATVEKWGERSVSGIPEGWTIGNLQETSSITIGKSGKASYCGDKSLDFSFSDDVKAYIATGFDKDEGTIWLTRVKDVPAGVPVLIKGVAEKTYEVRVTDSQNSYYKNMFKGNNSGSAVQIPETDGDLVNYYLSGDGVFKSVKGYANIGNNKCYLQLPSTFKPAVTGETQKVTIKDIGKASYAAPVDLDFTNVEGLKAFTATGYDKSTKTIWLTRVVKAQKGEGLLLKGDPKEYEIPSMGVQSAYMNMFVGNTSGEKIQVNEKSDNGSETNYYLSGDGTFKSVNGYVNINDKKCYLALPTSMVSVASTRGAEENYKLVEPEMIQMPIIRSIESDDDNTTAIKDLTPALSEGEGEWYTLQGQRVAKPGKGIYIRNGRKVVIR